jgi:hypothetical protein
LASVRDFIKSVGTVLPEIPKPEKKPTLNERFVWTAIALVAYLVMATTPLYGYGGPGSSNAGNRAIQEPTVDWTFTFWKDPQYGALQLVNQVSYLTRAPWFVAPGQPKNARSTMVWVDVRYVLP